MSTTLKIKYTDPTPIPDDYFEAHPAQQAERYHEALGNPLPGLRRTQLQIRFQLLPVHGGS
eukprot:2007955-Amphidinium_carterae.1